MKLTNMTFENKTAIEVLATVPTLAELYREFKKRGSVRKDILANKWKGEWTSTWVLVSENEVLVIERPTSVSFKGGSWIPEGGVRTKLPRAPNGFVTQYDKKTGFPVRTGTLEQAKKKFGKDASNFYASNGLRPVLRGFYSANDPFRVRTGWYPDARLSDVGARSCRRREIRSVQTVEDAYKNGYNDGFKAAIKKMIYGL